MLTANCICGKLLYDGCEPCHYKCHICGDQVYIIGNIDCTEDMEDSETCPECYPEYLESVRKHCIFDYNSISCQAAYCPESQRKYCENEKNETI